jgi:hypothetical protein
MERDGQEEVANSRGEVLRTGKRERGEARPEQCCSSTPGKSEVTDVADEKPEGGGPDKGKRRENTALGLIGEDDVAIAERVRVTLE